MRKVALVFTLAVIAPSLVLAWLAVRSLRDQEFVADRQQTLLYQNLADSTALAIAQHLTSAQRAFAYRVENLFKTGQSRQLAEQFDARIRSVWPLAEVGFAVSLDGGVLAPSLLGNAEGRKFRAENDRFLCSTESCEVYWNSPKGPISLATLDAKEEAISAESSGKPTKGERTVLPTKEPGDALASKLTVGETNFRKLVGTDTDGTFARFLQDKLHVMFWHRASDNPQLLFGAQVNIPKLTEELWEFVRLSDDLKNQVCLALLDDTGKPVALSHLGFNPLARGALHDQVPLPAGAPRVTAKRIPRHNIHNVVVSTVLSNVPASAFIPTNGRADWKHPFVAAEIGEALPHWEVAVYLLDPARAGRSASVFKLTLGLLVALLVLAIAVGSWLIVADLNRQLRLARQKTDFVSNVSHELKTPLTSIRMFTEMLAEDRVQDDAKRRHFLGIITAETARLTRLINNVLDFARLERGEKKYHFAPFDLAALVQETVESYRPHLENLGFTLRAVIPTGPPGLSGGVRPSPGAESPDRSASQGQSKPNGPSNASAPGDGRTPSDAHAPLFFHGDRDAIAQVLVNLLSNAEKYSGDHKEIEVALESKADSIEVRVFDRGLGVPSGCEEKIFDQFYRAHDSLGSGIQGSGLGLTLARQIARSHGGEVVYQAREGGGSCFALKLPVGTAVKRNA
jgi:signal transduction histidine kinase